MILSRLSIRLRLTLWYALTLLTILGLFCLGSFLFIRNRWLALDREKLEEGFATVETVLRNSGGDLSDIYHLGQESLFQLARDGKALYQTLAWQEHFMEETSKEKRPAESGIWKSPRGQLYRMKRGREPLSGFEILIARDVTSTMSNIRLLAVILTAGIPLAFVLAVAGGLFLAGRALSPVAAVTKKAGEINAENLSERLPISNPGDEIGRLAAVFNEALARLDRSFDRLRRFTSDASHELRTPLTSLRSVGEVALRGSLDKKSCREAIGSMLEETERLTRLVESLLTLARGDSGKAALSPRRLDVSREADKVVEELRILAEEKNQTVSASLCSSLPAFADEAALRQALSNVLHNAIVHTPLGGHIEIRTSRTGEGKAVIDITDDGPGIPAGERNKVFERFYRVRGARSNKDGGAGLGLAIARWAVEANRGTIAFLDKDGPGTHCRITLPGESRE